MRSLLRAVFLLTLILCLTLAAIIGLSYRDPSQSRWAYLFANPDGSRCASPCLFGIDLEKMKFKEADHTFRKHWFFADSKLLGDYSSAIDGNKKVIYRAPSMEVSIEFFLSPEENPNPLTSSLVNTSLNNVFVQFYGDKPSISEMMQVIGRPDGIEIYSLEDGFFWCGSLYFIRNHIVYQVVVNNHYITTCFKPTERVDAIYLSIYKPSEYQFNPLWTGFAPFEHYFAIHQTILKDVFK
jgi:hypothetical protein